MDQNFVEPEDQASEETPASSPKRARRAEDEVLVELNRLGTAFMQAVQALAGNAEEALDKVGKNEQVHDFLDKVEDVAESVGDKVREIKVTGEIKNGLIKGLSALTEQMNKLTKDLSARSPANPPPASSPAPSADDEGQDIPIQEV